MRRNLSALNAHRFLMRSALAASICFAWVFVLQFFYMVYGSLSDAFLHTILLYALTQIITTLATPYAAMQLHRGVRRRMVFGVFVCMFAVMLLGAALSGVGGEIIGVLGFSIFLGVYRAIYWTPYVLERVEVDPRSNISQEVFIAFMPAIAGFALFDGIVGATVLLFAASSILIASIAPLATLQESYERFVWGYRQTFAELFEPKYNSIVEAAFIEGMLGAALLLFWPLSIFIIVGFSYSTLGLVLSATLLLGIIIRPQGNAYLEKRVVLHAALAASSWMMRLIVATPIAAVIVDAYSSAGRRPGDYLTLEQSADNGTYVDEYTVLKEIALSLGRVFMCVAAAISIALFTLPIGLAIVFVLAAAASAVAVISAHRRRSHALA